MTSVMGYVEGRPINEYCDAYSLPIVERLRLMRDRGGLTGPDAGRPEEVSRKIANCNHALARLRSRIPAGDR